MKRVIAFVLSILLTINVAYFCCINVFAKEIAEVEPNETVNTAAKIELNEEFSGEIGSYNLYRLRNKTEDIDYLSLDLEANKYYVITMSNYFAFFRDTSLIIQLINPYGKESLIRMEFVHIPNTDFDRFSFRALYSGTYYLKLYNYVDFTKKTEHYYSIKLSEYCDVYGHTLSTAAIENQFEATCIDNGSFDEIVYCAACGIELSRTKRTIPALGHDFGAWAQTKAPTCTVEGIETRVCLRDGMHKETRTVEALGHSFVAREVKATSTTLGYMEYFCANCGELRKNEDEEAIQDNFTSPTGKLTLKHSTRTANAIKVQWTNVKTATGYQVQISTKDGKKWSTSATLKAGVTNYTFKKLSAGNNYKFRVRFYIKAEDGKSYYSPWSKTLGSPTLPSGTTLTKLSSAKKAFNAQWKKNAAVNGYQIQYGLKSNFSGAKTLTVKNAKTLKATVKKLSAKKTYYVRIRTYKTISKVNYFSSWSKTYKVKTK